MKHAYAGYPAHPLDFNFSRYRTTETLGEGSTNLPLLIQFNRLAYGSF